MYLPLICKNKVLFNFLAAFCVGSLISLACRALPALHGDKIIIGDIMLLIPGLAFTNAVKDIFIGDTISGVMRLIETILWAAALALGLLALGALALGLSTDFFPWRILCSIRKPFSTFFMQIQFPWRFVGMAVPMLSAAAAWGYLREEKDAKTGMAALIALCVVFSGYTMQTMVQRLPELEKETYTDTRIGQFEYTYPCTEKTALKVGDVRTSQPGVCNVLSYEKRGTELTATVQLEGEAAYIELPLLYYPGYRAEIDGQAQTVARGTNNMVRVYGLSSGESGTVHVWYQPPTVWLIAQGASVLGALLLAASLRRMRRRA